MRALPVQPEPLWRTDFRQRIAVSLWFMPAIFAAAAIVAANSPSGWTPGSMPRSACDRTWSSDPGSAATFAAAITAATLAFVAVVFATTLVAIQLAASQYSPRTVRIFIRSRITRVTLGLFLATFVFSVIILVSNRAPVTSARQFAPVVSVTTLLALTVATVFGFVAYLHGVVRLMRVQYLLEAIAAETRRAIEENFPPASAYADVEPPSPDPSPRRLCYAGTAGVVTATDLHGLADCAGRRVLARADRRSRGVPGAWQPVALVRGRDLRDRDVTRFFLIRGERTFVQDRRSASGSSSMSRSARCPRPSTIPRRGPGHRPDQRPAGHHRPPARPDRPAGRRRRHGPGQAQAAQLRRPARARADRGHPVRRRRTPGRPAPARDARRAPGHAPPSGTLPSPAAEPAGSRGQRRAASPVRLRGLGARPGGLGLKQDTSRPPCQSAPGVQGWPIILRRSRST